MGPPVWHATDEQRALLGVALLEPPQAAAAWREWKRRGDLRQLDAGSYRLLPLVYRNLLTAGVRDSEMATLEEAYRHSCERNHVLWQLGARVLRDLHAEGIQTLVLKGVALSLTAYRDAGARPMQDFDIAVRPEDALRASDVLQRAGFRSRARRIADRIPVTHSDDFADADGHNVDLHWGVLWQPGPDEGFWDAAVRVQVHGVDTGAPCATDELLEVCAHGTRWAQVPGIRWVADAMTLISTHPIDWNRLAAAAAAHRVAPLIGDALGYLRTALGASIPVHAVSRLQAAPADWLERRATEACALPPSPARSVRMPALLWVDYRGRARSRGERPGPAGFLSYLQRYCELDRRWQLPLELRHVARGTRLRSAPWSG